MIFAEIVYIHYFSEFNDTTYFIIDVCQIVSDHKLIVLIYIMVWDTELKKKVITKTSLYNFDHLKPHFYIVKLGFTGVYIIFHISAQKHRLWVPLEPPRRGGSNEYPQSMFWAEIWKISEFFIWKLSFYGGKIFSIFE